MTTTDKLEERARAFILDKLKNRPQAHAPIDGVEFLFYRSENLPSLVAEFVQAERDCVWDEAVGIARQDSLRDWAGGSTGNAVGTAQKIAAAILAAKEADHAYNPSPK